MTESESLGSVEDFFLKRKRDRTEEKEKGKRRAFQGSKKTPRSSINTKDKEIIKKFARN